MSEALLKVPDAALEQARMMLDRARWGATRFQKLDRAATQRIVSAVAAAGHAKAQHYAEWAVRETGMGVVDHKRIKNEACSRGLAELYSNADFMCPRIDAAKKIVELPRPAGVIFALDPGHQSGGHGLFQDTSRADDPECHHPEPPSRGQGLLRRCGAHAGGSGEGCGCA